MSLQPEKEGKRCQSTRSPGGGTPGRRTKKREGRGHATSPGKVNQQRTEGEILSGVPGTRPIPEGQYLRATAGVCQP